MASNNGASGQRAAENTKGFFKGIGDATESLRKNVNAFADDMIGSKSNTHANTADRDREYTTGHVAGSGVTHDPSTGVGASHPHDRLTGNTHSATNTTGPGSHFTSPTNTAGTPGTELTDVHNTAATGTTNTANTASTGIHPDAQKTAAGIGAAIERAGEKIEEKTNHTSTGHGATYTR